MFVRAISHSVMARQDTAKIQRQDKAANISRHRAKGPNHSPLNHAVQVPIVLPWAGPESQKYSEPKELGNLLNAPATPRKPARHHQKAPFGAAAHSKRCHKADQPQHQTRLRRIDQTANLQSGISAPSASNMHRPSTAAPPVRRPNHG